MSSTDTEAEFFREKRPWSKIKDKVLESYMIPYLTKVAKLQRPILLIDGFAGPGAFDDGSVGSPLIMVKAAEERANNHYVAIFVNKYAEHHSKLESALSHLAPHGKVLPIRGDSQALLKAVQPLLGSRTLFLYLDPFGLKGCEFDTLRPFLERDTRYSTEIVINMSAPTMHRLATWQAVKQGRRKDSRCGAFNRRLSLVLGGEWWKDIMWTDAEPEAKVTQVIECYGKQLKAYLPYTGACPVREQEGAGLKYWQRHEMTA